MSLTNDAVKLQVIDLDKEGNSQAEISRVTGIPRSTIGDFLRKESFVSWWADFQIAEAAESEEGPKILLHDIETAPTKAFVWGRFKQNIGHNQVIQEGYVLTWAAQWLNEGADSAVFWDAIDVYDDWDPVTNEEHDFGVIQSLWRLYDEADIVVAHNAPFDTKTMNARFAFWGLRPPSPYKVVDTLRVAKSRFRFPSNRLDSLADYLGVGRKHDTGGFELWRRCMLGEREAFFEMVKYNRQDIHLLREVYLKLRPWDQRHPNLSAYYSDNKRRCVVCGSDNLEEQDSYPAGVSRYVSYQCKDCGHWSRARKNLNTKEKMKNTNTNVV